MPTYQVYDDDGTILRTVTCPETMIDDQVVIGKEFYIQASGSDTIHKVVDDKIIKLSEDDIYAKRIGTTPRFELLGKDASDTDLNLLISDHFLGRVDVQAWRMANFAVLRQLAYPSMADYLDAVVKEDQAQIGAYRAACLAVKTRFPKE